MKQIKFAITGHTEGLGRALNEYLIANGHIVVGFSRANNYDIGIQEHRQRIIATSFDCDVFINNAYHGHAQTDLLFELFSEWRTRKKLILNIGSEVTSQRLEHPWTYLSHKASLDAASYNLSDTNSPCHVTLMRFGWIGTERALEKFKPKLYLDPKTAAEFIYSQIDWAQKFRLTECYFRC